MQAKKRNSSFKRLIRKATKTTSNTKNSTSTHQMLSANDNTNTNTSYGDDTQIIDASIEVMQMVSRELDDSPTMSDTNTSLSPPSVGSSSLNESHNTTNNTPLTSRSNCSSATETIEIVKIQDLERKFEQLRHDHYRSMDHQPSLFKPINGSINGNNAITAVSNSQSGDGDMEHLRYLNKVLKEQLIDTLSGYNVVKKELRNVRRKYAEALDEVEDLRSSNSLSLLHRQEQQQLQAMSQARHKPQTPPPHGNNTTDQQQQPSHEYNNNPNPNPNTKREEQLFAEVQNLKEALRQMLASKRQVAEELQTLQRHFDEMKLTKKSLEKELDSVRNNSGSLESETLKLKERVHALSEENEKYKNHSSRLQDQIKAAEPMMEEMSILQAEHNVVLNQLEALRLDFDECMNNAERQRDAAHEVSCKALRKAHHDNRILKYEVSALKGAVIRRHNSQCSYNDDGGGGDDDTNNATTIICEDNNVIRLRAKIEDKDLQIELLQRELSLNESARKELLNTIHDLKGNIRVICRVRPFLREMGESSETHDSPLKVLDEKTIQIVNTKANKKSNNNVTVLRFSYDKVFLPSSSQECIFNEVSPSIQSAIDGYNVCLFSYGQTGAGKTFTMGGVKSEGETRGIIPRAMEYILFKLEEMKTKDQLVNRNYNSMKTSNIHTVESGTSKSSCDGLAVQLHTSCLEIYNEEIHDLLVGCNGAREDDSLPRSPMKAASSSLSPINKKEGSKLTIKQNHNGKFYVPGLNGVDIDCSDTKKATSELKSVLQHATKRRASGVTGHNAQSSRSHLIFRLKITIDNKSTCDRSEGVLNFCDLAGSERFDGSGAIHSETIMKEMKHINKSLSALGATFNALHKGSSHIPYRDSRLTLLLQDCLGGDGKALMIGNLSPTFESGYESLCTLRFIQQVNQVELGKATRNIQTR